MDGMVSLDGILIQTSQTLTDLSCLTPRQRDNDIVSESDVMHQKSIANFTDTYLYIL